MQKGGIFPLPFSCVTNMTSIHLSALSLAQPSLREDQDGVVPAETE